jgi:membrane fusion protein, adhesin transport system
MATAHKAFDLLSAQRTGQLPAIQLARTPRSAGRIAFMLILFLMALVPTLLLAPWTQTVYGNGSVIAWNPTQRPQFLTANVEGRVKKWHVYETQKITRGQRLVTLEDNDPDLLRRLQLQKGNIDSQIQQASERIVQNTTRIEDLSNSKTQTIAAADANIRAESTSYQSAFERLDQAKAAAKLATQIYQRNLKLYKEKLLDGPAFERSEAEYQQTKNGVNRAQQDVEIAKDRLDATKLSRIALENNADVTIKLARESLTLAKAERERLDRERTILETTISRQENLEILAPVDGKIFRLLANGEAGGQLVRPADRLARLVPDARADVKLTEKTEVAHMAAGGFGVVGYESLTDLDHPDIVAELAIDGNDLPILKTGDRVLLQFEGWAAVQFASYPEAATGTFEGTVFVIDPTADDKGHFRVLVRPAKTMPDGKPAEPWPNQEILRQGVRAQGWVLVNQVSVGYELWRSLNGFPVAREQTTKQGGSFIGPVGK